MDYSAALQAFEDRERALITDNIRSYGVHLTYVAPDLEEGECLQCRELGEESPGGGDHVADVLGGPERLPPRLEQPFCYTTGLHGIGHPELLVLGLARDLSTHLLNMVAQQVTGHHQDLMPGQLVPRIGLRILVEEIPNPGMVIFRANDYYDRSLVDSVPAYQLTWADPDGRFPWEKGHVSGAWGQPRPGTYRA
ncbi:DUF4262 domain-containing protein [Ornithinimicrobium cryptoxanthini]|uniref:DUF4262 domain-containing protein n=1 Tax=Ornithinimicrobium cryptoxanthini TaxID=2934161 RepID=A0ABY4YIG1_9MICO|nr:DUF4262 domain-containing protein [Ornithinimicrobium cryptoxanthini]USQ76469.1 DUF4262 domain-containing protein [Ornithinimicrobium cryptoxanthini]